MKSPNIKKLYLYLFKPIAMFCGTDNILQINLMRITRHDNAMLF